MHGQGYWRGKKIMITGASGFIGSHLCRYLLDRDAQVHGISRRQRDGGGVNWWRGDLSKIEDIRRIMGEVRPEHVFHLAGFVSGSRALDSVLPILRDGLVSTVNVLVAATEAGCEGVLLAGSVEEPEALPAVPCSPYAAAKWAGGGYARMFRELYDTPAVNARIYMVYGPGQIDLKKLVPYVTLSLLRKERPLISSGERPVDWVYVSDVVRGLAATSRAGSHEGVDIGTGRLVTVRQVVEIIYSIVGADHEPIFGTLPDRSMERVQAADSERTMRLTGWRPTVGLEDGLRDTVDWYRRGHEEGRFPPGG